MKYVHKLREEALPILLFILAIWVVFLLDMVLPLSRYGLRARNVDGLWGIFSMTFLHVNLQHIMANTVPLIILLSLLAGSKADSKKVVPVIMILGGCLLWIFGRPNTIHVGASLLVFGLAVYLVVSGILEKRTVPIIISIIVIFLYGSTLLHGISPLQKNVSWEGHLLGGVAGAITAWLFVKQRKNHI